MITNSLSILGVLCLTLAISEWLNRNTPLRHLGTALLVILITAIVANLGLIPTSPRDAPVYDWLLGDVVRLAIFWMLLQVVFPHGGLFLVPFRTLFLLDK